MPASRSFAANPEYVEYGGYTTHQYAGHSGQSYSYARSFFPYMGDAAIAREHSQYQMPTTASFTQGSYTPAPQMIQMPATASFTFDRQATSCSGYPYGTPQQFQFFAEPASVTGFADKPPQERPATAHGQADIAKGH